MGHGVERGARGVSPRTVGNGLRTEAQDTARAAVARKATKTRELRVPPYGRQAKRAMRKMGASHTTSEPRGKNERRGTQHETSLCTTTLTPEWRKRQAPPQREAVASGTSPGVCQVLFDAQTRALFRTLASAFFFLSRSADSPGRRSADTCAARFI